ncbi:MAG: hypothetical protein IKE70_05820, partial [Bacilli bacterium]|nr:hypothetical protein [Bacilli bacterium]
EIKEIEKKNKKKNKKNITPILCLLMIGILLIIVGVVLIFIPKSNSSSNKEMNENATVKDYVGIYKNENGKAYLYSKDGKEVSVNMELDNYSFSSQTEIENGKLTMVIIEDKTTISLSKDNKTIFVTSDIKELKNISFTKEKEYTKEDFYQKNYGNIELLDSKYNGIYKKDNKELRIYQKNEDSTRVYVKEENSSMDIEFKIIGDNTLEGEVLEEKYKIILEDDKITFETINGEKTFDGTYTKEGTQTIDDIIKEYY